MLVSFTTFVSEGKWCVHCLIEMKILLSTGRILEYERQAYASSIYEYNVEKYGPANAVNGEGEPDTRTGTYLLEERTDPWWYVDFGGKRRISKMKIRIRWGK